MSPFLKCVYVWRVESSDYMGSKMDPLHWHPLVSHLQVGLGPIFWCCLWGCAMLIGFIWLTWKVNYWKTQMVVSLVSCDLLLLSFKSFPKWSIALCFTFHLFQLIFQKQKKKITCLQIITISYHRINKNFSLMKTYSKWENICHFFGSCESLK